MRKLIHSNFELDLSLFKISDTEENNWFSDSFFTKYTFPFNIDLSDDLDIALGFISLYNTSPETYYDVMYVHNDKIETAVFEIESHQDKLSCVVRYGLEQLPSFDKKLSELSLDKFDLSQGTTIYDFAETIISKTWPEVNYNFPQIHVDKYDVTEEGWSAFKGIINNRQSDAFLINTVDTQSGVASNRNVMQPLPYLIHILQRGMIDAGYTLAGDILTDESLKKACVFAYTDYFYKNQLIEYTAWVSFENYLTYQAFDTRYSRRDYGITLGIQGIGSYTILGNFIIKSLPNEKTHCYIKLNGAIIFQFERPINGYVYDPWLYINIQFDTITPNNTLEFYVLTLEDSQNGRRDPIYANVAETTPTGVTIVNENKIDLTKAVPDISFQDFIKVIKNWFNYDLTIVDKLAVMNPVESQINYENREDFVFSEIKNPLRKFTKGISFLLKFKNIENIDHTFLPVFQNKSEIRNTGYTTDEKTIPIEINGLPLPLLTRKEVETAYALDSDNSKVFLVKYDGKRIETNYSHSAKEYELPLVHLKFWEKWFNFRINSDNFIWNFSAFGEELLNLEAKKKIFAYNKTHIIKTINRTEVKPDYFEVDIETESLE
jgi:hypothetical protein